MPRLLTIILGVLLACTSAEALIFGGSNLGLFGYPSYSCGLKPQKPFKPFSFSSQFEIDSYNTEVEDYNLQMGKFISCLREYVDNAKNDIERIKEKIEEAVTAAKY